MVRLRSRDANPDTVICIFAALRQPRQFTQQATQSAPRQTRRHPRSRQLKSQTGVTRLSHNGSIEFPAIFKINKGPVMIRSSILLATASSLAMALGGRHSRSLFSTASHHFRSIRICRQTRTGLAHLGGDCDSLTGRHDADLFRQPRQIRGLCRHRRSQAIRSPPAWSSLKASRHRLPSPARRCSSP